MSSNRSGESGVGIGFLGVLGIAFIVLKLTGHIEWPWLWVLAPLWGPMAILLVILLVILVAYLAVQLIGRKGKV